MRLCRELCGQGEYFFRQEPPRLEAMGDVRKRRFCGSPVGAGEVHRLVFAADAQKIL